MLLEVDGARLLTDPVWGERASPVTFAGPKRFQPVPVAISDAERRRAPRVLLNLEVDYASEDNYLFAYITDISATGIFVRTTCVV